MAFLTMDESDLLTYRPERVEPEDFTEFWVKALAESRTFPAELQSVPVETGLATLVVEDATFPGFGGQPIKGWLIRPRDTPSARLPAVVYFDGLNFTARASAPALYSGALMDEICPPETVYASYNHYAGSAKEMSVYRYNGHEDGGGHHVPVALLSRRN